jgi:hypothetical protein
MYLGVSCNWSLSNVSNYIPWQQHKKLSHTQQHLIRLFVPCPLCKQNGKACSAPPPSTVSLMNETCIFANQLWKTQTHSWMDEIPKTHFTKYNYLEYRQIICSKHQKRHQCFFSLVIASHTWCKGATPLRRIDKTTLFEKKPLLTCSHILTVQMNDVKTETWWQISFLYAFLITWYLDAYLLPIWYHVGQKCKFSCKILFNTKQVGAPTVPSAFIDFQFC